MGTRLISFLEQKLNTADRCAFCGGFFATLLIHLYKFVNTLPNHDSLYNYYADQNILGSGRWALSLACGFSSYYDLPWVIGLSCCILIGLTTVVVVRLFRISNPVLIVLTGGLLAAAPATTETFFFLFTADGYLLAMLLASLGAYFTRIGEKRRSRIFAGILCICVSCGIYQAYVSFALVLAVCHMIQVLLEESADRKTCMAWIFRQILVYTAALAGYYLIWKALLKLSGTPVNQYQGIDSIGFSLRVVLKGVVKALRTTALYFLQWNVLEHGFSLYSVLNLTFLGICGLGLFGILPQTGIVHRSWALILVILGAMAVVPFAGIWHLVSDSVGYRAMMLQSLTVLYIFAGVLFETWAKPLWKDGMGLLLTVILIHQGIMANISYFYMHLCYERTVLEAAQMAVSIQQMRDSSEFTRVAVLGTKIYDVQFENMDAVTQKMLPSGQLHMLSGCLEHSLLFDEEHTLLFLNTNYDLGLVPVSGEEREALLQMHFVREMPCWPAGDSMQVVRNTLVIKLSDRIP